MNNSNPKTLNKVLTPRAIKAEILLYQREIHPTDRLKPARPVKAALKSDLHTLHFCLPLPQIKQVLQRQ